jgi:hypothetical protein
MPIRFRCTYCNQLMGIARRKAGTVVRCPSCTSQVIVPDPGPDDLDKGRRGGNPPVFERSDFDEIFRPARKSRPAPQAAESEAEAVAHPLAPAEPRADPRRGTEPLVDVEQVITPANAPIQPEVSAPPGIWLSPALATLLSVAALVALALAFAAGLLVGLFLQRGPGDRPDRLETRAPQVRPLAERA